MMIRAFVILAIIFSSVEANAVRVVSCNEVDSEYIASKLSSGVLIEAHEIEKTFPRGSLKYSEICEVRNEIIMDGLAFTLYKPNTNNERFISVYNGLDGSSKLYGPFKK